MREHRASEAIPADCLNVVLHVWDYLDGRLPVDAAATFASHLDRCRRCDSYRRFQQRFLDSLRGLRVRRGAPWHVKAKVLDRLAGAGFRFR